MDKRILSSLMAEYELIRQENAREEDRRRQEIAQRHPELWMLMENRRKMVMQAALSLFSDAVQEDPEKLMAEYNQKIAAMLTEKGYPADYLSSVCRCEICHDQGHYYDEGSVQRICPCLQKAYHLALSQRAEETDDEITFDNFDFSRFPDEALPGTDVTQREYMQIIRQKCLNYAENVPDGKIKTLLLHGGSGLGKTYLLHCIAHHARSRGTDTLLVTAYDLLMTLKNAYFSRDGFSRDGFSRDGFSRDGFSRDGENANDYFDVPLLIIDDLGMEPLMENITVEQIYHLINARLSKGLFTAISTNLSLVELKQRYTERVSSRLLDPRTGLTLQFLGKDIRLMK